MAHICAAPWRDEIEGGIPFGGNKIFRNTAAGYTGEVTLNCKEDGTTFQSGASCSVGYSCIDSPGIRRTAYANVYVGDQDGLTEDTSFTYSAANTARKCEFYCSPEAEWREMVDRAGLRWWECALKSDGGGETSSINLYVDDNSPKLGELITLRWSASGIADGGGCDRRSTPDSPVVGWNGRMEKAELETGGSVTFLPSNAAGENQIGTYAYSLCTSSVLVTVHDPPVITKFEATPSAIDPGASSTLEWEATGNVGGGCYLFNEPVRVNPSAGPIGIPTFITVSGSKPAITTDIMIWSGAGGANSKSVNPTSTRDYTLICLGSGFNAAIGTAIVSRNARVAVNGTLPPDGGGGGGGTTLTCSAPNTCSATCSTSQRVGLCSTGVYCCSPTSTSPPSVFTNPFSFGNPVAFTTVDSLFSRILSFLQATIVLLSLIFIIIGAFLYITSAGDEGRTTQGKKAILAALIGLALGIAAPAFLREIASILGWGTPNLPTGVGTSLTLIQIATNVLNFLLTIIGILAIIMLVIGGIMYLTAAGDEDRIDQGKKIVKYSLIGITVALASLVLVKAVAGMLG